MTLPLLGVSRAQSLVDKFSMARVLVVGDIMLDRFIVGRVTRISPEAPVPVVRFHDEYVRLGGAANVAHNVATLGGQVTLVGIVGPDAAAEGLRRELLAAGIAVDGLVVDKSRRTTEKVRVVTERNQQVMRIDYEHDEDAGAEVEHTMLERIATYGAGADTLLVSDYLKGAVTHAIVQALVKISASAPHPPVVIDPKIAHLACYAGATLVTPNHHEAEIATQRRIVTDGDAREVARSFRERAQCSGVLITRGEDGMWLSDSNTEAAIRATAHEVADVTGAGDTVVATLTLALAAGASMAEAAMLANYAAGVVVGKFGTSAVSTDELMAAVREHADSANAATATSRDRA